MSAGAGDVRIYMTEDGRESEVPFALTESGPAGMEPQRASVNNVALRDGALEFDLAMPGGEYTDVALDLDVKNFV